MVVRTPALPLVVMTLVPLTEPGVLDLGGLERHRLGHRLAAGARARHQDHEAVHRRRVERDGDLVALLEHEADVLAARRGRWRRCSRRRSPGPSTTRWIVLSVETRSVSRPSADERDADRRTSSSRSPRPSTASPTVSAVVQTLRSEPSTSTDRSRPCRTTIWPRRTRSSRPAQGATRSPSPTAIPPLASTSATVRPKASTCDGVTVDVDRHLLVQDGERAGHPRDDGEHGGLGDEAREASTRHEATAASHAPRLGSRGGSSRLRLATGAVLDDGPTVTDP